MSYYFVNNKYPVSDPNTDLNFNNDILYQDLVGDVGMIAPKSYDNGDQTPRRSRRPDRTDIRQQPPTYNILLSFILIVILVVITFYLTRTKSPSNAYDAQTGGGIKEVAGRHLIMPATQIH